MKNPDVQPVNSRCLKCQADRPHLVASTGAAGERKLICLRCDHIHDGVAGSIV